MRWITTIVVAIVLSSPARTQTRGGLDDLKAAGGGVGATLCSEFNQSREKPEIEAMFLLLDRLEPGTATGKPRARRLVIDVKLGANGVSA